MSEKLQKVLARAGVGSRRQMEEWIAAGRISVNGKVAGLGDRVEDSDRIEVDGRAVRQLALQPPPPRVIMYYKQVGEVTSRTDPEGRGVVFDSLPKLTGGRWITVGRLDVNTSGLLLFTNDGELAARLMHPSYQLPREYAVRVLGEVTPEIIERLKKGVQLEDGPARFETIDQLSEGAANEWFRVSLREGRKREVRRLWESQELKVSRLIRVRFGPIELPRNLSRGQSRDITGSELVGLYRAVGLELPKPKPVTEPAGRRAAPKHVASRRRER